jgi:hypothetical protein
MIGAHLEAITFLVSCLDISQFRGTVSAKKSNLHVSAKTRSRYSGGKTKTDRRATVRLILKTQPHCTRSRLMGLAEEASKKALANRLAKRTSHSGVVLTESSATVHGEPREATTVEQHSEAGSSLSVPSTLPKTYEWTRLDNYAKIMQSHEEVRAKHDKVQVQAQIKADLDKQVADVHARKLREKKEDTEYYKNLMVEIEQWREYDTRVLEDRRIKAEIEKLDRDEQMEYSLNRRKESEEKRQREDRILLERIDQEMQEEAKEIVEKKRRERDVIKELMKENEAERRMKLSYRKQQAAEELRQLQEYNALIERQEKERQEELSRRVSRQKELIRRMEETVTKKIQEKSNDDNMRALKQQAERDARCIEIDAFKMKRLDECREEMKRTLAQQIQEKERRQREEAELREIHAQILRLDSEEFIKSEKERQELRRKLVSKYKQQLNEQIKASTNRNEVKKDGMSQQEILLNRDLIDVVERLLKDEGVEPNLTRI